MQNSIKFTLASSLALWLSACGGSSSSSPSPMVPPPPPPPPAGAAPIAAASASVTTIEEGQPFTLDGSGSTDTDTNMSDLTFTWTQLDGSPSEIISANEAITEIIAGEITSDETATFQLSVSDGTNTDTATIEINFTNIFQMPRSTFTFDNPVAISSVELDSFPLQEGNLNTGSRLLASPTGSDNINQVLLIDTFLSDGNSDLAFPINNIIIPDGVDQVLRTSPGAFRETFYFTDETNNEIIAFETDQSVDSNNQAVGSYPIESPCAIAGPAGSFVPFFVTDVNSNISSFNIVGQRNGGFEIIIPTFTQTQDSALPTLSGSTTLQSVGTNESYCYMQYVNNSNIAALQNDRPPLGGAIMAVDVDAQTINLFIDHSTTADFSSFTAGTSANPDYQLAESVSILPESDSNLEIVAINSLSNTQNNSDFIILLSDGNHIGEHRAVFVSLESEAGMTGPDALSFRTDILSWDRGVPQNAVIIDPIVSFNQDLIVINSSTSPEAIIFERDTTLGRGDFNGPSFFELGLDVDTIFQATIFAGTAGGLITHSPNTGVLQLRLDGN